MSPIQAHSASVSYSSGVAASGRILPELPDDGRRAERPILFSGAMVRAIVEGRKPDWSHPDWAYFLGVVHGDGHVSKRSISISVAYKDSPYCELLSNTFHQLGLSPKLYRARTALRLDAHSIGLANTFREFKRDGIWSIPDNLRFQDWVAGVVDTDGCVSLASRKCCIAITLKRSGNLNIVRDALLSIDISCGPVHDRVARFNGKPYEIEDLRITSFSGVCSFAKSVELRHYRKKRRLLDMVEHIRSVRSNIPMWKRVADFCKEPRTWKEIAEQFSLSKRQVDIAIQQMKAALDVHVIPPPEALTRYRVKGELL